MDYFLIAYLLNYFSISIKNNIRYNVFSNMHGHEM